MSTKRLTKEFAQVAQDPPDGFSVALAPSQSIHTWHVTLAGPPSTPYAGGVFGLVLSLPVDYPFKPPVVRFATRIYHPNVTDDSLGGVCLGLLKPEHWKPSTKLRAVLEAVRNLLVEPAPDDPLEDRIADEFRNHRPSWEVNARKATERYAMGDVVFPPTA